MTVKHRAAEATVEGVQQQAGAAGFVMAHPMPRLRAGAGDALVGTAVMQLGIGFRGPGGTACQARRVRGVGAEVG